MLATLYSSCPMLLILHCLNQVVAQPTSHSPLPLSARPSSIPSQQVCLIVPQPPRTLQEPHNLFLSARALRFLLPLSGGRLIPTPLLHLGFLNWSQRLLCPSHGEACLCSASLPLPPPSICPQDRLLCVVVVPRQYKMGSNHLQVAVPHPPT